MTREEAIKVLNTYDVNFYEYRAEEIVDAIGMAIEALTQDSRKVTQESDLISRQDAIDIVRRYDKSHMILKGKPMIGAASIVIELEDLPSADAVEVVRCKDCKHRGEICSMRYIEMVGGDERIYDYSTDNGYCSWGERREDGEA